MRKLTKTAAVVAAMATMAMGATVMASAAPANSWGQVGSSWYYYDNNGDAVENQWVQADGKWYFLGEDGKMATNAFINDNEEVSGIGWSDPEVTGLPEGGDADDPVYYVSSDGVMVTGWQRIDLNSLGASATPSTRNKWFYFGGSGMMFGDQWVQSGNDWYYMNGSGVMVDNDWDEDGDYYLGKDGVMVSGWYQLTDDDSALGQADSWIYADDDEVVRNGWESINGRWFYFGDNAADTQTTVSGAAATVADAATTDYEMNSDSFIKIGSTWYYLRSNGAMDTGWFTVREDGFSYKYFATSAGEIRTSNSSSGSSKGVRAVSGKNYYFYGANIDANNDGDYTDDGDAYAGKYIDDDYIIVVATSSAVTSGDTDANGVLTNADGIVVVSGSRADAVAAANAAGLRSGYKVYRLGTSTVYSY